MINVKEFTLYHVFYMNFGYLCLGTPGLLHRHPQPLNFDLDLWTSFCFYLSSVLYFCFLFHFIVLDYDKAITCLGERQQCPYLSKVMIDSKRAD